MTPTAFGQFLEFSVPTRDIQESLNFYRALGFSELTVGDIRDYHYSVISDGRIAIGLHAGGIDEPALTFVKADVAASLPHLVPDNQALSFSRLGIDSFHEIGLHTPAGHLLIVMEARTFSRSYLSELPIPVTGRSVEISLGCRDINGATIYWSTAGFIANPDLEVFSNRHEKSEAVELLAPGLRLGLRTELPAGRMALRFAPDDLNAALESIDRCNLPVQRTGKGTGFRLTAPEGTHLYLVAVDAG